MTFALRLAAAVLAVTAVAGARGAPDVTTPGRMEPAPEELVGVDVSEHPNAALPLDLPFTDENGRAVRLGDYFDGRHPVVLNLGYYRCPMLCGLVLDGLVDTMKDLDWEAGAEFRVVTVSIDPGETPTLAKAKKQNTLRAYGRPGGEGGWAFLTGSRESIDRLAETVGFGYRYLPDRDEYVHGAVLFLITPDGRVSRYLYGIANEPATFRMALLEASEGQIGTVVDRVLLYCFHYDADEGRYALAARRLMRLGGGIAVVVLGTMLFGFWRREAKRRRPLRTA